jgi:hypothetical protein
MTAGGAVDGSIDCSIRLKTAAGLVDRRADLPSASATTNSHVRLRRAER